MNPPGAAVGDEARRVTSLRQPPPSLPQQERGLGPKSQGGDRAAGVASPIVAPPEPLPPTSGLHLITSIGDVDLIHTIPDVEKQCKYSLFIELIFNII